MAGVPPKDSGKPETGNVTDDPAAGDEEGMALSEGVTEKEAVGEAEGEGMTEKEATAQVKGVAGAEVGGVGSSEDAGASEEPPETEQVTMKVWRGDPSGGAFVDYVLPRVEGEVVLDVVHRLQATQAHDLAARWNCKAGKCGSCSAEINGKPCLMCMTRMEELPGDTVTVAPMKTFPIIRDLVTDVTFNFVMARQIPAFRPKEPEPDGTYRMQQIDVNRIQEFHKCIECFLCQDVCHVIRDHEVNKLYYAGPRFFVRAAVLEMHPLDTIDRRDLLKEHLGLGFCNITKCCTEVCPEHIHITDNAIIPLKERVADSAYDPVAWLGRKIRGRRKARALEVLELAPAHAAPTSDDLRPAMATQDESGESASRDSAGAPDRSDGGNAGGEHGNNTGG